MQHRVWLRRVLPYLVLGLLLPHLGWTWSGYQKVSITIVTLYQASQVSPAGALMQFTPTTPSDTEGCTYSGKGYAWIDFSSSSQPDGKSLYATLVAAQLAGKLVGFGVNGCSGGYPVVYGINVWT
jgi:hypothetical protein